MKKKILAIALAVVLVAVAGYSTLAYFTSEDTAKNVITADTLEIQINEYQNGQRVAEGDNGITITANNAVPGDVIPKAVYVQNLPENTPAWIRVKVMTSVVSPNAAAELDDSYILLDYDTTGKWVKSGDWYYYTDIVYAPNETGVPLFTNVTFDLDMPNAYQGATVTIELQAQAVQAYNNGATYDLAAGWPS